MRERSKWRKSGGDPDSVPFSQYPEDSVRKTQEQKYSRFQTPLFFSSSVMNYY